MPENPPGSAAGNSTRRFWVKGCSAGWGRLYLGRVVWFGGHLREIGTKVMAGAALWHCPTPVSVDGSAGYEKR